MTRARASACQFDEGAAHRPPPFPTVLALDPRLQGEGFSIPLGEGERSDGRGSRWRLFSPSTNQTCPLGNCLPGFVPRMNLFVGTKAAPALAERNLDGARRNLVKLKLQDTEVAEAPHRALIRSQDNCDLDSLCSGS